MSDDKQRCYEDPRLADEPEDCYPRPGDVIGYRKDDGSLGIREYEADEPHDLAHLAGLDDDETEALRQNWQAAHPTLHAFWGSDPSGYCGCADCSTPEPDEDEQDFTEQRFAEYDAEAQRQMDNERYENEMRNEQ